MILYKIHFELYFWLYLYGRNKLFPMTPIFRHQFIDFPIFFRRALFNSPSEYEMQKKFSKDTFHLKKIFEFFFFLCFILKSYTSEV